nr:Myosin 10A, isoform D [Polyrhizophydium stewartii]
MLLGCVNGVAGWFPAAHVRLLADDEILAEGLSFGDSMADLAHASGGAPASRAASVVNKSDRFSSSSMSHAFDLSASARPAHAAFALDQLAVAAAVAPISETGPASDASSLSDGQQLQQQSTPQQLLLQQQLPQQTRNWYNKYRAMPRYEKRSFSTSFALVQTNDSADASSPSSGTPGAPHLTSRERSGSSTNPAAAGDASEASASGHRAEKSWASGFLWAATSLSAGSGASAASSIAARLASSAPHASASSSGPSTAGGQARVAVLGAPAVQKQLWVDFVGGPEAVDALGLSKKEIKRQEVIFEIISTESDYLDDLEIVCEVSVPPLHAPHRTCSHYPHGPQVYIKQLKRNKMIRPKDMAIIFSNIEQLLPVNQELLKSLMKRRESSPVIEQVGDVFIRVVWLAPNGGGLLCDIWPSLLPAYAATGAQKSDYLKMYTMYCSNHPYALIKLQNVRQNKSVAKFLDQCAQQPECRSLNLANFLLKPVQRVCKYPLFLRELIKATEPEHPDSENLLKALLKIETVVTIINEGARQTEHVHKMLDLQAKFLTKVSLVAPSRVMIRHGPIDVRGAQQETKRREVFMFNDMLVIAKPEGEKYKLIQMISFDEIYVNSFHDDANVEHQIEIAHTKERTHIYLVFENSAAKETWITALRGAIDEWLSQKNRIAGSLMQRKSTLVTQTNDQADDDESAVDGAKSEISESASQTAGDEAGPQKLRLLRSRNASAAVVDAQPAPDPKPLAQAAAEKLSISIEINSADADPKRTESTTTLCKSNQDVSGVSSPSSSWNAPPPSTTAAAVTTVASALGSTVSVGRNNTAVNKPVRRCKIVDVTRGPGSGSKSFYYTIHLNYIGLPDTHTAAITQTFDAFFDLHLQLIGHFPEAAGITTGAEIVRVVPGQPSTTTTAEVKRILPELPGQMMFVSEAVARNRIVQLQSYLDVLLSLPPKISRSPVVLKFFRGNGT